MTTKDKRVIAVGLVSTIFALLPIVLLLFVVINFKPFEVAGIQMESTLMNGDKILVRKNFSQIYRNDIVVYNHDIDGKPYPFISRVVGMPGDMITQTGNEVVISNTSGEIITKAILIDAETALLKDNESMEIKSGKYFVLGDNRNNSLDSRSEKIGLIEEEDIIGKFLTKYKF